MRRARSYRCPHLISILDTRYSRVIRLTHSPVTLPGVRILLISDVYFPRVNGVSTSILTYRRALQALGHTVRLIAPRYGALDENEPDLDRVAARPVPFDPEDRLMRYPSVLRMTERLRNEAFDLLHIQTPFVAHYAGMKLSRALDVPRVETYHTHFEDYFEHYLPWAPRAWLRIAARRLTRSQCNDVDAVVVPSAAMQDVLRAYGVQRKIEVIPTGMDEAMFRPGDGIRFRERLGIAPECPVLVHIGRIAFEKNIDFLLHATARVREQVPDVILIVAGDGPAVGHLKRLAAQLGLADHVRFEGYLARERELLDCYRAADVFVFASRTETQGLVLLEAMAQGVPVVSTAVMGTRDVLREGRGALIAPENDADFASRVVELLENRAQREALGRAGLEYAREWATGPITERMVSFYEESVALKRRGGVAGSSMGKRLPTALR